jgi:AraC family transcriptional regulator, regulatory protein of adaptative response / methylated-DNA-[protein]-cysteine methyltransferase
MTGEAASCRPFSDVVAGRSPISTIPGAERAIGLRMVSARAHEQTWRLDGAACDRARLARDRRFDGVFFTGVRTTRIYCRPVCPVRPAKSVNVSFFPTAAAAERAGFRPCLRCRPEAAPGSPAWAGTATTVARGQRLIEAGFLDHRSVDALAAALGIGPRHLLRLFLRHARATPSEVAATLRVQRAKRLLDETSLRLSEIAFAAGFGSIRRFNDAFRSIYGRAPSTFRRGTRSRRFDAKKKPRTRCVRGSIRRVCGSQ